MNELMIPALEMTSKEIAELTGKRHDNVLRDIRTMLGLGRLPITTKAETPVHTGRLSVYANGERVPGLFATLRKDTGVTDEYILSPSLAESVLNRYGARTHYTRIGEEAALSAIEQVLGISLIRQFQVKWYLVDGYCRETNTVYEIYERYGHASKVSDDARREHTIVKELGCTFKVVWIDDPQSVGYADQGLPAPRHALPHLT